jgi:pantoate--beta-alanine ligase
MSSGLEIVRKAADVRNAVLEARLQGKKIGFVPTMGALHEGHENLVRSACERTGYVVSSIFVNPKQFGPKEDYTRYPRDETADAAALERLGCDLLFSPGERDLYTSSDRTRISVQGLDEFLCGSSRPGHFKGVALVIAKLFNIVQPDEAYFGQKDAQQAVIIQRMSADLDFPVRIVIEPTVREPDGLARSSRNEYLSNGERKRAVALYEALAEAKSSIEAGERSPTAVKQSMLTRMTQAGFDIDYAEVVDGATLRPVKDVEGVILIAVAGWMGGTRLIDNIAVRVKGSGVEEIVLEFPEWSRYEWKR